MMWYCWESNPCYNHGPQLDGLADFSAKKVFAVFILNRPRRWDSNPDFFLVMEFLYAERTLNRVTFYKRPNQLDDDGKTLVPYP